MFDLAHSISPVVHAALQLKVSPRVTQYCYWLIRGLVFVRSELRELAMEPGLMRTFVWQVPRFAP